MKKFKITAPDGHVYDVTAPDGTSQEDALDKFQNYYTGAQKGAHLAASVPHSSMSWMDVAGKSVKNLPSSAVNLVKNTAQPFVHPIQTVQSFYEIGQGLVSEAKHLTGIKEDPAHAAQNEQAVNAVAKFFEDRYGSWNNFKNTIATDPAGVLADAATVLTLGGGSAARAPGAIGELGEAASKVGQVIDPVTGIAKLGMKATKYTVPPIVKHVLQPVVTHALGLTTGAGPEAIRTAVEAGKKSNQVFQKNLRGQAEFGDTVDMAKRAVGQLGKERGQEYRAGMGAVKADKAILDYAPINDAVDKAESIVKYGKTVKDEAAHKIYQDIKAKVDEWQKEPSVMMQSPSGKYIIVYPHRTAEGLDALKQSIGAIRDETKQGSLSRKVADDIYNSVKGQITQQAPTYAKTMKDYAEASDQMKELTRTFALGDKATEDTSLRKLQSMMRNDVSANYGARAKLGEVLAQKEPDLPFALAGQALSSKTPRGLSKLGPLLTGASGGGAVGVILAPVAAAKALPALATASPRLVGEGAYYAGKGAQAVEDVAKSAPVQAIKTGAAKVAAPVLRGSFQAGRADEVLKDMGGWQQ